MLVSNVLTDPDVLGSFSSTKAHIEPTGDLEGAVPHVEAEYRPTALKYE